MANSTKTAAPYKRVAELLQSTISEQHKPNEMLPSERVLAQNYSVSRMTMRKALDVLENKGLVKRHHGRGTIVSDPLLAGEIAVIIRPGLLDAQSSPYFHVASSMLVAKIHEDNSQWQVKLHVGRKTADGEDFPATLDLLAPEVLPGLRGVFTFNPLYGLTRGLAEAKVPVVSLGIGKKFGKYQVGFDNSTLFDVGLAHLAEKGCRSVGLIGRDYFLDARGLEHDSERYLVKQAAQRRLEHRGAWIHSHRSKDSEGGDHESFGYEAFMRFWQQPERPDALLVSDDVICRGVLRASLQLGVKLPDDLKLVTYAGRGTSIAYHMPLTRVEYDISAKLDIAIEMMSSILAGETLRDAQCIRVLPGELIPGATT